MRIYVTWDIASNAWYVHVPGLFNASIEAKNLEFTKTQYGYLFITGLHTGTKSYVLSERKHMAEYEDETRVQSVSFNFDGGVSVRV